MSDFNAIAIPLGVAMGLSLTVERLIELFKRLLAATVSVSDLEQLGDLPKILSRYQALTKLMHRYGALQRSESAAQGAAQDLITETDAQKRQQLLAELAQYSSNSELDEATPSVAVAVAPATLPRPERVQRTFLLQVFGFALGILLARFAELRLFSSFGIVHFQPWLDYLLTGLLIGGGSAPIHTLLQFISDRKVAPQVQPVAVDTGERQPAPAAARKGTEESAAAQPASVPLPALQKLKDIAYYGGVDKEKLEWVHLRPSNPDLIIYHHTAMQRASSFEDVVNVIKSKRDSEGHPWLTGYNCVVTEHGGIHPFCRWDRYGNHAAGLNRRSLGLAFNGNFETDSSVPFSNPDGKYGPPVPTDEELDAGARVVALWCHLYGIPLDFKTRIIPHRQVSPKTCPGNNFPTAAFQALVTQYHSAWASQEAQQYIDTFRHKPYVMAQPQEAAAHG